MIIEIDCNLPDGVLSDSVDEFLKDLEDVLKKAEESGVIDFFYMDVMAL